MAMNGLGLRRTEEPPPAIAVSRAPDLRSAIVPCSSLIEFIFGVGQCGLTWRCPRQSTALFCCVAPGVYAPEIWH